MRRRPPARPLKGSYERGNRTWAPRCRLFWGTVMRELSMQFSMHLGIALESDFAATALPRSARRVGESSTEQCLRAFYQRAHLIPGTTLDAIVVTLLPRLHDPLVQFYRDHGPCLAEWCSEFGIDVHGIDRALTLGMDAMVALYEAALHVASSPNSRRVLERALPRLQASVQKIAF